MDIGEKIQIIEVPILAPIFPLKEKEPVLVPVTLPGRKVN